MAVLTWAGFCASGAFLQGRAGFERDKKNVAQEDLPEIFAIWDAIIWCVKHLQI
ncbi:hypothetical protein MNBD_ALPHA11-194, partial [hydrothermal vent metagenome]